MDALSLPLISARASAEMLPQTNGLPAAGTALISTTLIGSLSGDGIPHSGGLDQFAIGELLQLRNPKLGIFMPKVTADMGEHAHCSGSFIPHHKSILHHPPRQPREFVFLEIDAALFSPAVGIPLGLTLFDLENVRKHFYAILPTRSHRIGILRAAQVGQDNVVIDGIDAQWVVT